MMTIRANGMAGIGGLGSAADVMQLQQALMNLALKTGNPAINPGPATGELTPQTMGALQQALSVISSDLPSWLYLALQGAFIGGSGSATVKSYITQYATQLAMAINTAAAKMAPTAGTSPYPYATLVEVPWYQTTGGMVAIAAGILFGGWFLFIREPAKAAA